MATTKKKARVSPFLEDAKIGGGTNLMGIAISQDSQQTSCLGKAETIKKSDGKKEDKRLGNFYWGAPGIYREEEKKDDRSWGETDCYCYATGTNLYVGKEAWGYQSWKLRCGS